MSDSSYYDVIESMKKIRVSDAFMKLPEPCIVTFDTFFNIAVKTLKERPQGEWIYGEDECGQDGWFCSECGFFVPWYYQYYEKDNNFIRDYKACPHCLAEMITYTGKDRDKKEGAE